MHLSSFGGRIRRLRMDHGITLRDFARRLGVSPTYISQIEQGNFKPPAESVVVSMARILGQDSDELLALAGRVADDLDDIIRGQPKELATFLRKAKGLNAEDIALFSQQAERIHQERATRHHETCSPKRNGVCLRSVRRFSSGDYSIFMSSRDSRYLVVASPSSETISMEAASKWPVPLMTTTC